MSLLRFCGRFAPFFLNSHLWVKGNFFSFVGQNKKNIFQEGFCEVPIFGFFRRDFVHLPNCLLFLQQILICGQSQFFLICGSKQKKIIQEGFCEVPIFGFFFVFGQEGFRQFRETPPLLVQISETVDLLDTNFWTPTLPTVPRQVTTASTLSG